MDIEFRSASGSRVGFIIGSDIKDSYGNKVGMIVGNDIKDSYGNRAGMLNGSDIKDCNGNRVGMIIGNDIKDTYGNRVGYPISSASEMEMAAAGLLLFGLKPEAASASSPVNTSSSSASYENSPQYESKAVSSGSSYDNLAHSLVSGMDESTVKNYYKVFQEVQESNRKLEEERGRQERERHEKEEKADKEAWKKKKIFFYGLGGLVGGLFFTFFNWLLATDHSGSAVLIGLGIGITSIILFYRESVSFCLLKGLLAGIISFLILFLSACLRELVDILPFPVSPLFFLYGFIFGVLIIWLMRNYFYWIHFKDGA